MNRTLPLLSLLPFFLACGEEDKADGDYWMPYCEETRTPLAFDEDSPLGFSAEDVALALGTLRTVDFVWARGGSTTVDIELGIGSTVEFVDLEEATPPEDATVPSIAVVCDDYVAISVTLGLKTADGLLDEDFALTMSLTQADYGAVWAALELADFSDPSIFDDFLVDDATSQNPTLDVVFGPGGGISGEIGWSSEGESGDTAWASSDQVASFGTELE